MFVIGLTGSIGMGKSTTAKFFAEEGVPVHDADAVVHQLYEGEAAPAIEAAFPGTTTGGKVDRDRLSAHLVAHPGDFKKLEALVHPAPYVHLIVWLPVTVLLCLALLRPFKATMVALQFAHDAREGRLQ